MSFSVSAPKAAFLLALVAVSAGAALTDWRASKREATAEAAFPATGQFVDVDGVRVHAHVEGSGPDLVLIHGASGNTRDWTLAFIDRVKEDYRVIAFDRPGMGWTDRLPQARGAWNTRSESPAAQAALLARAAEKIGVNNPVVLGHSYGGAVALAWALDHPLSALVIVAGASNEWEGPLGPLYRINSSLMGGGLAVPLISAFASYERLDGILAEIFEPDEVPPGYLEHVGAALSLRREAMRTNAQQVNGLKPHLKNMVPRYGEIGVPTEIIHGTADTIVPLMTHSDPLSRQIDGAVLTSLDGVGHMPQHARPEAVADAIARAASRAGLRYPHCPRY